MNFFLVAIKACWVFGIFYVATLTQITVGHILVMSLVVYLEEWIISRHLLWFRFFALLTNLVFQFILCVAILTSPHLPNFLILLLLMILLLQLRFLNWFMENSISLMMMLWLELMLSLS